MSKGSEKGIFQFGSARDSSPLDLQKSKWALSSERLWIYAPASSLRQVVISLYLRVGVNPLDQ